MTDNDDDQAVVAYDAHCSCGAAIIGACSADDVANWADTHEHHTDDDDRR